MAKHIAVTALILFVPLLPVEGLSAFIDWPDCSQKGLRKLELSKADTTVLGLTIGEVSFEGVQAKLGRASFLPRRELENSAICYLSSADGTVLIFSSGAMGGWKDITEFEVRSSAAVFPQREKCVSSPLVNADVSTDSGTRLGMSPEQLHEGLSGMTAQKGRHQ